jgi:hypothetical protein
MDLARYLLSNLKIVFFFSDHGFLSLIRDQNRRQNPIRDNNRRKKTVLETIVVEYVEFLLRQKSISETNIVSDQRRLLPPIRDK